MKFFNAFLLLFILFVSHSIQAVTRLSPTDSRQSGALMLSSEYGKTGTVDAVDSKGQWIRIDHKEYKLHGTGLIKLKDLRPGMHIYYNLEKTAAEKKGRITRIWIDNDD